MRACVCPELGAALVLSEIASPDFISPQSVLIKVAAAGVNFADTLLCKGQYQDKLPFPLVPGMELAGTVLAVGDQVTSVKQGDRVMALVSGGGFAELAVALESDVVKIPDQMDFVTAAGFPAVYGTSHMALKNKANLRAGETLVVHGAAGGVGLTAVELGKAMSARVIATAGGSDKLAVAQQHGADLGLDYKTQDLRQEIKAATDGRGADVIYDPVGGEIFDASLRSIAPDGRILIIGFASGTVPQIPANILLVKNVTVIGFWFGAYRKLTPNALRDSLTECMDWWAEGKLKPHISNVLPMSQANEAFELLKSRKSTGKVVIEIT